MDCTTGYTMTINGKAVTGDHTINVVNPATGKVFTTAPAASAADLDNAVAAAKAAFPAWKATPIAERKRLLVAAAKAIEANSEALTALFTREQGRPFVDAQHVPPEGRCMPAQAVVSMNETVARE